MSEKTQKTKHPRSMTQQRKIGTVIRWIIAAFLIFFSIFPLVWIISASLNPTGTLATARIIPKNPGFQNFKSLIGNPTFPFFLWFWNSIKITTITTFSTLFLTTMAAYAFSRFRFSGRTTMLKAILLIQVFPNLLSIVALFLILTQFGTIIPAIGLNTHLGLIIVYLGGAMGMNIWLMKGYMDTIPREIDESARVDGATDWQIFWRLILPLLRPILVVIGILSFIGVYGDFIVARTLLKTTELYTVMVGLQIYTSGMFSQKWGIFAAGALISAFPIMVIYLTLQDQIVGGLTQGAVKG
ncbi:MAG TPA: sugar ABC transporter permease [Brevefilum fermentans]|jgi:arabinogalactan oligomer / maltooligosaccharide transport system permease protein|uniref:Maltose transporter subunit membrane component of ABC superfamily n=1 Tax=Candidatus Brevifilum fermentans TaxID=1986204 RepID=A0A1Y6K4G8_9CHLR|nr:sugar ABC transporter permease [Brevefilum fermentans]MDI9566782.1 sugar ABC transporter permease [Chloroflexota bacterium]SMX54504.1 maltose transporter subunit; membrane component of ABC superfamily [Brevefilum fermentans]HQA29420.1 sugar ABC transporter permease [Brevefilum fermentans]